MGLLRNLLLDLSSFLPEPRVIYDREGGTPYLSRWYLIGKKPEDDPDLKGQIIASEEKKKFDLFLHRFHRSDDDGALHNHPWSWAVSLVLAGGYMEERRVGDKVARRIVRPLSLNFIRGEDYHRVDLIGPDRDAWSLFLVGPRVKTWYFWDRDTKARMQWRSFIEMKQRGEAVGYAWEPDAREKRQQGAG
jgi:hypothetical protein